MQFGKLFTVWVSCVELKRQTWYNKVTMIDLASAQAFFWLCFGLGIFLVASFLSWCLFEVVRLLRQSNEVVEHVRNVVADIEEDFNELKEKFGTVIGNVAGVAKGASKITGLIEDLAPEKKKRKRSKKS